MDNTNISTRLKLQDVSMKVMTKWRLIYTIEGKNINNNKKDQLGKNLDFEKSFGALSLKDRGKFCV